MYRPILVLFVALATHGAVISQTLVDISGAVKIGNTSENEVGAIRFTGTDFQGYINGEWVSLFTPGPMGIQGLTGAQGAHGNPGGHGPTDPAGPEAVTGET